MATFPGEAFASDLILQALHWSLEGKNHGRGYFMSQLGATAGGDESPPVISNMTPTPETPPGDPGGFPGDWAAARSTPLEFDLVDEAPGLRMVTLHVRFVLPGDEDEPTFTVYRDGEFQEGFASSEVTAIPGGLHFVIRCDDGWPPGATVEFDVDAVDAAGNATPGEAGGEVTLVSIAVTPASPTFDPDDPADRLAMTAIATYSDSSTADVTQSATWTSSAPAVATVTTSGTRGLVEAIDDGTTTITATVGDVGGATTVTIALSLVSIAVTPAGATFAPTSTSQRQQMVATGTYSNGLTRTLTATVTWTSSATSVATISNAGGLQGQVTGVASGSTTITATLGLIAGNTTLTVSIPLQSIAVTPAAPTFIPTASSDRLAMTATGTYADGHTENLTATATWTSGTPATATVAAGQVAPVFVGTSLITAAVGAISGAQTVTVDIPVDATSGKGVPINAFQWSLVGLTITHLYLCQESSGNLADAGPGGIVLTANATPLYQQTHAGWSRFFVGYNQTTSQRFAMASGVGPNPATGATLWIKYSAMPTAPGGVRGVINTGGNHGVGLVNLAPQNLRFSVGGATVDDSTTNPVADDLVHFVADLHDPVNSRSVLYTDEAKTPATYAAATDGVKGDGAGIFSASPPGMVTCLIAVAAGANAQKSDAEIKALAERLKWTIPWS